MEGGGEAIRSRASSPTGSSSARHDPAAGADAVFTVDGDDTVLAPGAVEIEDGLITWVG